MLRVAIALVLAGATSAVHAASPTNFGAREFGKAWDSPSRADVIPAILNPTVTTPPVNPGVLNRSLPSARIDLSSVARIGEQWGRVTSLRRSPEHNRRVGGVRNSYHLSGQAIDIARRPGVSHHQIVAAYRNAGYSLIEALDEGDHTHLAFGSPRNRTPLPQMVLREAGGQTQWRIIYAPSAR
ncbi:MAG: D-Ala-D-Ala carboxypeptidase family metallohydrolase [Sphingomicrobium sp.]